MDIENKLDWIWVGIERETGWIFNSGFRNILD